MQLQFWTALVALVAVLGSEPRPRAAQAQDVAPADTIAAAAQLYADAAYEEAITALDRLAVNPAATDRERAIIEYYRALCLLGLNRPTEAATAAEAMVRHDPLYVPPQEDLSPRTRQIFQQAQRRVLPALAQEQYARAKAAHEEGRAKEAVSGFDRLLEMLDVITAAGESPPLMADLRVLATGFRQLASVAAQAVAPPESQPAPPEPTQAAETRAPADRQSAAPAEISVTPPIAVRQDVPPWPRDLPIPQSAAAVVEVVIGPDGRVQEARITKALHPRYDQLLLTAARNWTYRPALRNGQPTPFVKAVRVELAPAR